MLLGKSQIVNRDYEIVEEAIDRTLSRYFGRLRFSDFTLSRIDYKLDIVTPYKDVYLDILKHLRYYYRKKFRQDYMTSVYYKGKSYVFNLYDKEAKERFKVNLYKNMLRLEIQLKNRHLRKLRKLGLTACLLNYFDDTIRKMVFEDLLTPLLYKGDYFTIQKSRCVLEKHGYKSSMIDKLLNFQKLILEHGISAALMNSGKSANTLRGYLVKLQEAGVNPIPLPDNCRVNCLPNLLSFLAKKS